ncbi:MAG: histidine kinase dimerization/phosphoacceptor domain-containing protein [Nocardioidaceae bacterium]
MEAAVAERTRIARELHDIVSHSISVVTIQTQAVRRRLRPDQTREAADLAAVEATARELVDGPGHVDLKPPVPDSRSDGDLPEQPSHDRTIATASVESCAPTESVKLSRRSYFVRTPTTVQSPPCCRREDATAARGSAFCLPSRTQAGTTDWLRRRSQLTAG